MVGQNIVFFNKIFTNLVMDVVMVGDGVVVVPVWCYLSLCFSFIDLGFVVCYLIYEFHRYGFYGVLFDF